MEPAVTTAEVADGVLQITLQDRENKNAFSGALIAGVDAAFARVRRETCWRAVVLTGYDSYFCSGGTRDALLSLHNRRGQFTDVNVYSAPLECEVPVVAAMQGHAIGGGLAFGLFADLVVMSRESVYTANFMKYGFTPGMGATEILSRRFGAALAQEMLLSARAYRGAELQQRGIPFAVLPRAQVLAYSIELAQELAAKPRLSLATLKAHLTSDLRKVLPDVVAQELRMHEKTLHQPQVEKNIVAHFGT